MAKDESVKFVSTLLIEWAGDALYDRETRAEAAAYLLDSMVDEVCSAAVDRLAKLEEPALIALSDKLREKSRVKAGRAAETAEDALNLLTKCKLEGEARAFYEAHCMADAAIQAEAEKAREAMRAAIAQHFDNAPEDFTKA